jgi:hypothetical protein
MVVASKDVAETATVRRKLRFVWDMMPKIKNPACAVQFVPTDAPTTNNAMYSHVKNAALATSEN